MGTTHEVFTGLLWIFSINFPSIGVELGEIMAMETIIVSHIAEGSRAVGHAFEFFLMDLLCVKVKVVDFMTWGIRRSIGNGS